MRLCTKRCLSIQETESIKFALCTEFKHAGNLAMSFHSHSSADGHNHTCHSHASHSLYHKRTLHFLWAIYHVQRFLTPWKRSQYWGTVRPVNCNDSQNLNRNRGSNHGPISCKRHWKASPFHPLAWFHRLLILFRKHSNTLDWCATAVYRCSCSVLFLNSPHYN
jgi:hypothetical protein